MYFQLSLSNLPQLIIEHLRFMHKQLSYLCQQFIIMPFLR